MLKIIAIRQEITVDPLLSIPSVARWLDVHHNTVYNMISRGEIVAYKVRSCMKVSHASVLNYLESQRVGNGKDV